MSQTRKVLRAIERHLACDHSTRPTYTIDEHGNVKYVWLTAFVSHLLSKLGVAHAVHPDHR